MPAVKVYPPHTLHNQGVSEDDFNIWQEQLTVYLLQDNQNERFFDEGDYAEWQAEEDFAGRIQTPVNPDVAGTLPERRRQLRTFISQIAKSCHKSDFQTIMRQSTSFQWIMDKLRENYDIQKKGVHFLNIIDIKWDPTSDITPFAFYNTYRTHIMNNLRKTGDVVSWKSADPLQADEQMTPMLEDLLVYNVLTLIDPRLPGQVKETFGHLMRQNKSLRDFRSEIFTAVPKLIQDLEIKEAAASIAQVGVTSPVSDNTSLNPTAAAINFPRRGQTYRGSAYRGRGRNAIRGPQLQPRPQQQVTNNSGFCRICHLAGLDRNIVTSHKIGDPRCSQLSVRDKQDLNNLASNGAIATTEVPHISEIAREYGYNDEPDMILGATYDVGATYDTLDPTSFDQ